MSSLRARVLSTVAGQLARPHGLLGRGFAHLLNRTNGRLITAAVEAAGAAVTGETGHVADIGYGGGLVLRLLLEQTGSGGIVHGIEISGEMLARARSAHAAEIAAGRLCLHEGSLTALGLPDAALDAAITVNTLYFVEELAAACAELARVIRPGGRLVVGIGDPDQMAKAPFTAYGFRLRSVAELIAALQEAGWTVADRPLPLRPIAGHLLVADRRAAEK